jgi:hypothetical protein
MMRPVAILLLVFFVSCSNRTGIPGDIIPPDSMQVVMKDIIMASQYASQYISRDSLKKDKAKANQELLDDIFRMHHITREAFKQSLGFYESRPDLSKKIFDSLSAYANRHQKELYRNQSTIQPRKLPINPKHIPVK